MEPSMGSDGATASSQPSISSSNIISKRRTHEDTHSKSTSLLSLSIELLSNICQRLDTPSLAYFARSGKALTAVARFHLCENLELSKFDGVGYLCELLLKRPDLARRVKRVKAASFSHRSILEGLNDERESHYTKAYEGAKNVAMRLVRDAELCDNYHTKNYLYSRLLHKGQNGAFLALLLPSLPEMETLDLTLPTLPTIEKALLRDNPANFELYSNQVICTLENPIQANVTQDMSKAFAKLKTIVIRSESTFQPNYSGRYFPRPEGHITAIDHVLDMDVTQMPELRCLVLYCGLIRQSGPSTDSFRLPIKELVLKSCRFDEEFQDLQVLLGRMAPLEALKIRLESNWPASGVIGVIPGEKLLQAVAKHRDSLVGLDLGYSSLRGGSDSPLDWTLSTFTQLQTLTIEQSLLVPIFSGEGQLSTRQYVQLVARHWLQCLPRTIKTLRIRNCQCLGESIFLGTLRVLAECREAQFPDLQLVVFEMDRPALTLESVEIGLARTMRRFHRYKLDLLVLEIESVLDPMVTNSLEDSARVTACFHGEDLGLSFWCASSKELEEGWKYLPVMQEL